jgi:hypothetical protein
MPLDAIVGGFEDLRKDAPIAEDPAVFRLPVFVKGVSDADGMGLAEDVRLLLDAFVRDPASVERERSAGARAADAPEEDVSIALHGLNLGPGPPTQPGRMRGSRPTSVSGGLTSVPCSETIVTMITSFGLPAASGAEPST